MCRKFVYTEVQMCELLCRSILMSRTEFQPHLQVSKRFVGQSDSMAKIA